MKRLARHADVVDETHGFKYFDERDLLGFVDGTENPTGAAAVAAATVGDEDPDFAGGSYVIVQKYLHDLAAWNALPVEEQERVDRPHEARRHRAARRRQADQLARRAEHDRRRRTATSGRSCGTTCRSARSARASSAPTSSATPPTPASPSRCCATCSSATARQLRPDPRLLDRDHRQPVLRTVRRHARRPAAAGGRAATGRPAAIRPPTLARHRQPERERRIMNNLHRELAPISDGRLGRPRGRGPPHVHPARRRPARRRRDRTLGETASAVGTGHLRELEAPAAGVPGAQPRRRSRSSSSGSRSPSTGRPSTTSNAARRTPTGSRSRTPPGRSPSPRTGRSSTASPRPASPASARAPPTRRSRCRPTCATTRTPSRRR